MIGYKIMESDMTCMGFQYEIGKKYSLKDELAICNKGFHFCENPFECLKYYNNIKGDKRLFVIEATNKVINKGNKSVTNKIKILEEITDIEKFFDENINNFVVDWYFISIYQKLSEEFIEKYCNKVYWYYISVHQTLSEEFIEKYKDKVEWYYISIYQKLSESFIEKHKDKIYWNCILLFQKLSEEFIKKYKDKLI